METISAGTIPEGMVFRSAAPSREPMARIYEEIKQSTPLRVPGQEAHITILRTADVLRHAVERAMAPFGISNEQYNVLRILRGAGGGGLPTLEIADRMLSRSPNITRLIDKKLVRRMRSRQDRRVVVITITLEGRELLDRLDIAVEGAFEKFPPTTNAETETLLEVLDRIREHMAVKTAAEQSR